MNHLVKVRANNRNPKELTKLLAQDRGGDAVALFMKYVGTPAEQIEGMLMPPCGQGWQQ